MNDNVLISICIPTRDRPLILKKTLDSIYKGTNALNKFEVVVYDSSDNIDTENLIKSYNFNNLIYVKGPNKNYLNLIESIKLGKGKFLKLHNDYTEFKYESLNIIIDYIEKNINTKPVLFFSNHELKSIEDLEFEDFNAFLIKINYLCTWSTMFGIWKCDFDLLKNESLNPMFPHTDLLLDLTYKKKYLIINQQLFINNNIIGKGGYDLFHTFSVIFLNLVQNKFEEKKIYSATYDVIKYKLLKKFLIKWYCDLVILPNKYTFDKSNIKKSLLTNFSYYSYLHIVISAYNRAFYLIYKKIISILISGKK